MPVFHEVRKKLGTTVQATIVIPQFFTKEEREKLYGDLGDYVVEHDTYEVLYRADFAFICSGTATLEASLIGIPFVLAYIAKKLDYFIASRLVKLNYLGLANILLEKKNNTFIHPEFIQDTVTPQNLLEAYYNFNKENFLKQSKELREYLAHGSAKNVAKIILEQ
jgi:lipid-A-disaccharide synthase